MHDEAVAKIRQALTQYDAIPALQLEEPPPPPGGGVGAGRAGGGHTRELEPVEGGTALRHTVEGRAVGKYEAIWREQIEPLHDLILEAFLDNVEAALASDH